MTDIVERLRNPVGQGVMHREAADEIVRLRAALTYISEHGDRPADQLALEALFALEGKMSPQSNQEPELTKRLRGENWWLNVTGEEAADEIDRLRQDNAEMRELIDTLVQCYKPAMPWSQSHDRHR